MPMASVVALPSAPHGETVSFRCADGVTLHGHVWAAPRGASHGSVIVNAATGVVARYYHRYARFLATHGFDVLTYDYRGIGASRPARLRGCHYRWRDWGEQDFAAALRFMRERSPKSSLAVVGHSFGGFLPGLARGAGRIDRMLTVGAQYAWWGDYALGARARLLLKWHVAMPLLTALFGYFPGRRLGWLEDLPAGVAYEWSFRHQRFERNHPVGERQDVCNRIAEVTAPILAVAVADDEIGSVAALRRTLDYYRRAPRTLVCLKPQDYDLTALGHFALFHDRHASDFWTDTLRWLRDGQTPWASRIVEVR